MGTGVATAALAFAFAFFAWGFLGFPEAISGQIDSKSGIETSEDSADYPLGYPRGLIETDYNYDLRFSVTSPPYFPEAHVWTEPRAVFMAMPGEGTTK